MTDIDPIVRDELVDLFPPPAAGPDWAGVRRRALQARARRAAVTAAIFAAAGVLASGLWPNAPSFNDQALAAIGGGRWIEVVVGQKAGLTRVVDLKTGHEAEAGTQTAWVYDTDSHKEVAWPLIGGKAFRVITRGDGLEPELAGFVDGYRKALRDGAAVAIRKTTYSGRAATVLRFSTGKTAEYEVAVDDRTHVPLWLSAVEHGRPNPPMRVLSIASYAKAPATPAPFPARAYTTWTSRDLGTVAVPGASSALGRRALWPGAQVGAIPLASVTVERVTKVRLIGRVRLAATPALVFFYGRADSHWIEVSEEAEPLGYDFMSYQGTPVAAAGIALPPVGRLTLACSSCGAGNHGGGYRPIWSGYLRVDGLYVRVNSPSRNLVLDTARLLRPTP